MSTTTSRKKAKYTTVTAGINKDGSPSIIAWYRTGGRLTFDSIPISNGKGGTITKITAYEEAA